MFDFEKHGENFPDNTDDDIFANPISAEQENKQDEQEKNAEFITTFVTSILPNIH